MSEEIGSTDLGGDTGTTGAGSVAGFANLFQKNLKLIYGGVGTLIVGLVLYLLWRYSSRIARLENASPKKLEKRLEAVEGRLSSVETFVKQQSSVNDQLSEIIVNHDRFIKRMFAPTPNGVSSNRSSNGNAGARGSQFRDPEKHPEDLIPRGRGPPLPPKRPVAVPETSQTAKGKDVMDELDALIDIETAGEPIVEDENDVVEEEVLGSSIGDEASETSLLDQTWNAMENID